MPSLVVVGAQWGDEGKGKVVDLYAESADVVVRYGGGANAGHTLVIGGQQLITHLIPSGVLHAGTHCVLGDGMVIDLNTLVDEIAECKARGLLAGDELLIADRAHVILPYHKRLEAARERRGGAIGTTLRGIGPAYEAKAARRGVRVGDLARPAKLRALVEQNLDELRPLLAHYGEPAPDIDAVVDEALALGESISRYVGVAGAFVDRALADGRNVLFEGAQGALLDLDHGTYPYVTSSTTTAAGAAAGAGIGPTRIDRVVGIAKAYTTRVGGGPFPTELDDEAGAALRQAGGEYGATTGRPRRCGWLDIPALRHAVRINGMDGIALTKLDVLCGLPEVPVCVAYELDGRELDEFPSDAEDLARVTPRYERFAGWTGATRGVGSYDDLPAAARAYVAAVAQRVGVDVYLVSVGPDRHDTFTLRDAF
ncbi:MAG: adenylosuccinate synthase [Deltaproteobacteria bacterium]|nr:MAG: adenylosuccinate synthase [Deltaproteobacteria bacterium]